jgi:hypothetical protein
VAKKLGAIPEGNDAVHVVYRMMTAAYGVLVSRLEVRSLRRHGDTWRVLLKGDMSALGAAMGRAIR